MHLHEIKEQLNESNKEKFVETFKRMINIFNRSKKKIINLINNLSDKDFERIKRELEQDDKKLFDFDEFVKTANLSQPTKHLGYGKRAISTSKGPRLWQDMDPSEVDWSDWFKDVKKEEVVEGLKKIKTHKSKEQLNEYVLGIEMEMVENTLVKIGTMVYLIFAHHSKDK